MMRSLLTVLAVAIATVGTSGAAQDGERATISAFDVASIHVNTSGSDRAYSQFTPGRFVAGNTTLKALIGIAYSIPSSVQRHRIMGGSDRILSTRFNVSATMPADVTESQRRLMLRQLLTDRFSLQARMESRQIDVYALRVLRDGSLGPDLRTVEHSCQTFRISLKAGAKVAPPTDARGKTICDATNSMFLDDGLQETFAGAMTDLIGRIQGLVDRPIVDETGLRGNFGWTLRYAPDLVRDSTLPSLFTALREQLGLALEGRKAPVDVLVINSVSMPSPN